MADLMLDCRACGKKFRITYAVKPKQVTCPQCKAKVHTAAETATGSETSVSDAAVAAPATTGATPEGTARAAAAKPRRLPVVLKPEDVEFQGWTYDREAEQARQGLQKADVLGVLWIGGVLLMVGLILFNLARRAHWGAVAQYVCGGVLGLGAIGLLVAGYLFWKWKQKPAEGHCLKCRGVLGLSHTVPTARECQASAYVRGAAGHAYRWDNGQPRKLWEIRKKWHVCTPCKRYFLAEKESVDFVGTAAADMEKREALYAEALAAVAATQNAAASVAGAQ
jgi:hypothetical protein